MIAFGLQRILIYSINLTVGELIYRLLQLLFEWRRRRLNICNCDWVTVCPLLRDCLLPPLLRTKVSLIVLGISAAFFCGSNTFPELLFSADSATLVCVYAVCRIVGLAESRMDAVHFIRTASGLDYGSGMAISYYYGYLKLVLPTLGDYQSKSIRDRIDDYEDREHVRFPVKKLFILVPDSMYTPNTLDGPTLTARSTLEPLVLNRAGIPKRVYHNAVYCIENTGGWYVAAEGASPLKTYYEALRSSNGGGGGDLERYRPEILAAFVHQLRRLLTEDEDCRDLYEVVAFRDRDAAGRLVDLGQVLRRAVEDAL